MQTEKARLATCLGFSGALLISLAAYADDSVSVPKDIDCHPIGMQLSAIETARGSDEFKPTSLKLEKFVCKLKEGEEHDVRVSNVAAPELLPNPSPRFPGEKLYAIALTTSVVPLTMVFQSGGGNDLHWAELTMRTADESKLREFLSK